MIQVNKIEVTRITVITMTCGLILAAALFKYVYDLQVDLWKNSFVHQAQKTIIKLEADMKNNETVLLDILSFYGASPNVTRKAFKSYIFPIIKRNEFIQALGWVPRVSLANRKKFMERAHREGFSDFQFTEIRKQGTMGKVGARPEYYPVYFIEPFVGNERALGFDLASESERLKAMQESRKSGKIFATNKIRLVQSKLREDGLLVFAPFYGGVAHRDRELKGFIVGVYRLGDMMKSSINTYIEKGMNFTIFQGNKISRENELFAISRADADLIRFTKEIKVFGKSWMLLFRGDKSFQGGVKLHPPYSSAAALLLLFLLISIVFEIKDFSTRQKLLSESNQQLDHLSKSDSLTGLANRRHFDEILEKEMRRSARDKSCMSLILIDIDHFKKFNDTHGHLAGDECLKQVARVLSKSIDRSHDMVARFGGEEFAVILPSTDLDGGLFIAERIRSGVEESSLSDSANSKVLPVTISLGLVTTSKDQNYISSNLIIAQADKALYEAKEQGRNRIVHFEFQMPSFA